MSPATRCEFASLHSHWKVRCVLHGCFMNTCVSSRHVVRNRWVDSAVHEATYFLNVTCCTNQVYAGYVMQTCRLYNMSLFPPHTHAHARIVTQQFGLRSPCRGGEFFFAASTRPVVCSTQSFNQWVPGALSPRGTAIGPCTKLYVELILKMREVYCHYPYAFMGSCLIKHADNCTFTLCTS
jgi:hypothetical protein